MNLRHKIETDEKPSDHLPQVGTAAKVINRQDDKKRG